MIVGTAGHIDHGKTSLVRALTGVDTDRLPEERRRGLTIELGYAFLDVPGSDGTERIGFVDVPGHERLVGTMLAGATGVDFALLLVAADDGVMPQTREHLAVLSLLGVPRAAAVVTKTDLAEPARVAQVAAETGEMLALTPLAGAPMVAVSARRGDGLQALRDLLFEAAGTMSRRTTADQRFRLAIDRVFALDGAGTVVTGTVHAGRVRVGDDVAWLPAASRSVARVRSLHAQDRAVDQAVAGQRCAVALAGVSRDELRRGQWLVEPGGGTATGRIDALVGVWPAEAAALRSGTRVHVHIGASDTLASVAILKPLSPAPLASSQGDAEQVPPGGAAYVQLLLATPIGAWRGDRVVLRDNAGRRTMAGGEVLDPFAPARYRRTPHRLAELEGCSIADRAGRLAALLGTASHGMDLGQWCRAEGVDPEAVAPLLPTATQVVDGRSGAWAIAPSRQSALEQRVLETLDAFHRREPETPGPGVALLHRLAAPRLPAALWRATLTTLRERGTVATRGSFVHLPAHRQELQESDGRLAARLAPAFAACGSSGCWARDLARDAREHEALVRGVLSRMARHGEVHQVVKDLFYPHRDMARLAAIVRGLAAGEDGSVTAARFRDATGLGRKRAIQLLEYFDRVGLLRRLGDVHRLRSDDDLFVETEA